MPLNLNDFKKTDSGAGATTTPKKLDLTAFKTEEPKKESILSKYQRSTVDIAKNTAAYGFEGVSRAAGGFTELTGRTVGLAAKGAGQLGAGIYRGVGNVVGLFSDKGEAALDQVAENFKANQYQFAERYKNEAQDINRFLSDAGENARETLLKTDKEAYDAHQKKMEERAQRVAEGGSDFKWSDMTEGDFWIHDMYGGLLQNAPTMALSIYGGAQAKVGTGVLSYLSQAGASTAFSTGMNASIEADSAYQSALDEGKSEEEARIEADRVFERNATANGGTEAAQMLLLFAPQMKFTSPWLKAVVESGKLIGAGSLESVQERGEDAIQNQSDLENFDWNKFTDDVTRKGLTRTDVVSFLMGMAFQGGGNIFVNNKDIEKAANDKIEQVAEALPDDGQGGTAEERVQRAIDTDPELVDTAVQEVDSQISSVTEQGREEAKVARLTDLAQEAIDGGRSPSEVVVALSGQIPTDRAREIVDTIESSRERVKPEVPTAKELMDQSPSELQSSIDQLDTDFRTKTDELKAAIETLQQEVKDAPNNSQVKVQKKADLERTRAELRRAEKEFNTQIEEGGIETRRQVERYILENTDFTRAEQRVLTDRVVDKIFNTGVNVPISSVINNEVRKFSPASATKQSDIEAAAARISQDKGQQKRLVDAALEVLQSEEFAPVVADMTIDQVMEELAKEGGQFQVKNVTRKPTGKAKFKNIKNDDLKKIATYIDAVRGDTDISAALDTDVMRLAERYGIRTDQSEKQIALAFERLIGKNGLDERVDALLGEQTELNQRKEKEADRKKKAEKVQKAKKDNILATGKNLPEEVKKQLEGIPFMKNVPVNMVKRITTPEGYEAFGRFYRGTVEFVENPDITTLPHEAFHVASQMALNTDERQAMYKYAREAYADPELTTDFATEEKLAQDFAEWYITEQNPSNLSDRIIGYFRKIKDFILDMVTKKNRAALKEIYKGILSDEVKVRVDKKRKADFGHFFQSKKLNQNETLLAVHNLTAENLMKAYEIGGLANPSMATIDPDILQFGGFGDITLVGDSDLITSSKAKTYAADAYSPRFPSTENTYSYTKSEKFLEENGMKRWDFDLEKFSYEAYRSRELKELYLKKTGKLPKDFVNETYEDTQKINELISKNDEDYNNFLLYVRKEIDADNERIFFGFTPSGTRRYKPLTAENASKYMNAQDGEAMSYGLGSVRAVVTPQINTVSKIRKAKDKLVTPEKFEQVKEELSNEFTTLMDEISKYYEDRGFGGYFDTADHIIDYYKNGRSIFSETYGYHGFPEELFTKLDEFKTKLQEMPTEYFETKFKRVVDLGEFHAAVIPESTPKRVREVLERYGITITEYKEEKGSTVDSEKKTEENRSAALKNAATNRDKSLFFQRKSQVDPLFDGSEDQQENSVYLELSAELERIMFEVETMFELSEAGYRLVQEDGSVRAVESSFPKWIPERLRSKQLMDKVLKQYLNDEAPKGARQAELHQVIEDYVMSELPTYLADEKVLNDYFAEQYKIADDLRKDTLQLMQKMAIKIAERQATMKKSDVKKTIRTNTGQIRTDTREFSKKMKERAMHFNRGYKKGYRQGASDKFREILMKRKAKRERSERIDKIKAIYRRVRQATRTGAYLPIEYQERLNDLFEDFDMTKMTAKTQKRLGDMALYFAEQEGEVPKHIAEKLKRLEKFAIGEMTDEQLEEFVTEVSRIFENGVLKKKLQDAKDEKKFGELVARVAKGTQPTGRKKINLSTFDPARFADMLDGGLGKYDGGNFKELVEPLRVATDEADVQSSAIIADALEEISALGNEFTEEEMARMMYISALEQNAQDQADALQEHYEDFDFRSPLTEKERRALDIMVDTFKEIRPEVAATYEEINNIPFPDNPRYFPFKYDKEVEQFDITEADFFDFKPAKTASGFTMQRQQGVNRVLDINVFQTFAMQVQSQLYYAKVQPSLGRTKDVVNSKPYQAQITTVERDYWRTFLADVASRGRRGTKENQEIKEFAGKIRQNINAAILGYKLSTILIQPTALFDAMSNIRKDLGTVAALKVIPQFGRMMFSPRALNEVRAQSLALQTRAGGQIELKELQDAQGGKFNPSPWRKGYRKFQEYAFAGIKFTDMRAAAATLETIKREYMKQGMSQEDAVLRAEQIMALSQASSNIANRPQFFNSEGTKFLLPFQTFVVNAFNNVRYDAISTELKEKGNVRGTVQAMLNLQFFVYAIAAEAALRDLYSMIWGYEDDDEDKGWISKWFTSAIGRLPMINYFIKYDGEFTGEINFDHPAFQAVNRVLNALKKNTEASTKDIYQATRGILTLLGVAGTQQLHQVLTAPDILGLGSIGMDLGISYDDRTLQEKQTDTLKDRMADGTPISESEIETLASSIYGKNYDEKGVEYRTGKNAELIREIALRQQYGFDDGFVDVNMNKDSNNDVKAYFATHDVNLEDYRRPVKAYGVDNTLMSDQLYKELRYIERAPQADKDRIADLALAETDEDRKKVIAGDKDFAKRAAFNYKVISKTFYESI